jgi:hypothetical protein
MQTASKKSWNSITLFPPLALLSSIQPKKKLPGHDYMSGFGINWDCEVGVIASICACITTYGRLFSLWCGFVGIESNLVEYSYVWYWHCLMLDWYGAA